MKASSKVVLPIVLCMALVWPLGSARVHAGPLCEQAKVGSCKQNLEKQKAFVEGLIKEIAARQAKARDEIHACVKKGIEIHANCEKKIVDDVDEYMRCLREDKWDRWIDCPPEYKKWDELEGEFSCAVDKLGRILLLLYSIRFRPEEACMPVGGPKAAKMSQF